jgi:hypothetical protein
MAFKSILTILTNPTDAELAISSAAKLARSQDAHLDVLVLGVDRTQVGYSYIGSGAVLMQVGIDRAEADARALETAANAALAEESGDLRYSVEAVVTQLGALTDLVASRSRFADLVVLPRPYGPGIGTEAEAVVEAALFEGKAPVLVLPAKGLGENVVPKRIVVAWNQSSEAMAATRLALPFLKAADAVNITVIHRPKAKNAPIRVACFASCWCAMACMPKCRCWPGRCRGCPTCWPATSGIRTPICW